MQRVEKEMIIGCGAEGLRLSGWRAVVARCKWFPYLHSVGKHIIIILITVGIIIILQKTLSQKSSSSSSLLVCPRRSVKIEDTVVHRTFDYVVLVGCFLFELHTQAPGLVWVKMSTVVYSEYSEEDRGIEHWTL